MPDTVTPSLNDIDIDVIINTDPGDAEYKPVLSDQNMDNFAQDVTNHTKYESFACFHPMCNISDLVFRFFVFCRPDR